MNRNVFSKFAFVLMAFAMLSLSGCATLASDWNNSPVSLGGEGYGSGYSNSNYINPPAVFYGNVVDINQRQVARRSGSEGGSIIGALAGGLLGHTIGKGDGRRANTVVGAVLGGVVGNVTGGRTVYQGIAHVTVRLDSGYIFMYDLSNTYLRIGDRVQVASNGRSANITRVSDRNNSYEGQQNGYSNQGQYQQQQYQQQQQKQYRQQVQYQRTDTQQNEYRQQSNVQQGNNPFNQ